MIYSLVISAKYLLVPMLSFLIWTLDYHILTIYCTNMVLLMLVGLERVEAGSYWSNMPWYLEVDHCLPAYGVEDCDGDFELFRIVKTYVDCKNFLKDLSMLNEWATKWQMSFTQQL